MKGIKSVVDPISVNTDFIKEEFLEKAITKRRDFNELMKEVYGE
jgi:fructose-1,6-bisphosphatase/inositol monophosphatase family enzyme